MVRRKKDLKNNILYVSHGDESPLYSRSCRVEGMNFIPFPPKEAEFSCRAKFRYRQSEQNVTVRRTGKTALKFSSKSLSAPSRKGSTPSFTTRRSV